MFDSVREPKVFVFLTLICVVTNQPFGWAPPTGTTGGLEGSFHAGWKAMSQNDTQLYACFQKGHLSRTLCFSTRWLGPNRFGLDRFGTRWISDPIDLDPMDLEHDCFGPDGFGTRLLWTRGTRIGGPRIGGPRVGGTRISGHGFGS